MKKRHLVAHAFQIDKKPYFDLYEKEALLREYLDYLKDPSLDGKYIGLFCGLYSKKNEGVIWEFVKCYIRDSQSSEGSI